MAVGRPPRGQDCLRLALLRLLKAPNGQIEAQKGPFPCIFRLSHVTPKVPPEYTQPDGIFPQILNVLGVLLDLARDLSFL